MKNSIFSIFKTKPQSEINLQFEFNDLIKNVISPFLKEMGFRKNGNTFNLKTNELTQVVSVQKSKWNDHDKVSFTFNIGFFDEKMYLEKSNSETPKFIREYDCQVRFRLGQIIKGHDYWYELNKTTNKGNLEIEIFNHLNNFLKPILKKNNDLNAIKDLLLQDSVITLTTPKIYKIKFLFKTAEIEKGKDLLEKEYFRALNPEDYVSKTIYPDGSENIKTSKSPINNKYVEILKEIAYDNKIELKV